MPRRYLGVDIRLLAHAANGSEITYIKQDTGTHFEGMSVPAAGARIGGGEKEG